MNLDARDGAVIFSIHLIGVCIWIFNAEEDSNKVFKIRSYSSAKKVAKNYERLIYFTLNSSITQVNNKVLHTEREKGKNHSIKYLHLV